MHDMILIKIEIKNLAEIKAAFSQAPALMTKNLNTAIKKTVFLIEGRAVAKANVALDDCGICLY